jgi:CDGSH-type Zn-finger protein
MELEAKSYAFCTCGLSQRMPFCDGAHKGTEHRPAVHACERAGAAVVCGCRKSGNFPWCDGSHKGAPPEGEA